MRIQSTYSHFGGMEYLRVGRPEIWREIEEVLSSVDSRNGLGTVDDKTIRELRFQFSRCGWTHLSLDRSERTQAPESSTEIAPDARFADRASDSSSAPSASAFGGLRMDKQRVVVELKFGESQQDEPDVRARHHWAYVTDRADVAVVVMPVKHAPSIPLQRRVTFEAARAFLEPHRRSGPAVPLVLVGVAP
jgi:hypothetical protein